MLNVLLIQTGCWNQIFTRNEVGANQMERGSGTANSMERVKSTYVPRLSAEALTALEK